MKYIALTIGPIFKTLGLARKTRELWGASYLFSHMMKEIMQALIAKTPAIKERILIPGTGDLTKPAYCRGAGLYPDRLICEAEETDFDTLQTVISEVLHRFAQQNHIDKDALTAYFQAYSLEMDIPSCQNPVLHLSPYLDSFELQTKCVTREQENALVRFLTRDAFPACEMYKTAFTDETGQIQKRFPSLIEIASKELHAADPAGYDSIIDECILGKPSQIKDTGEKAPDDQHLEIVKRLKQTFPRRFKTCHKYIAIVQADGDGIGDLIKNIGTDKSRLWEFSSGLLQLARQAADTIHEYGGSPVYLGGDDLLFFAPVVNTGITIDGTPVPHIMELVRLLDRRFRDKFPGASLSFGISITYNKFPMREALEQARHLLFNTAKKHPGKNCAAIKILKHGGKAFDARLTIKSQAFTFFIQMLDTAIETRRLNSIARHVTGYRGVLQVAGRNPETANETIGNFFKNSFDEDVHHKNRDFIDNTAQLLVTLFKESPGGTDAPDTLYTLLRILHFFKRKDTDTGPEPGQPTGAPATDGDSQ